MRRKQIKIVERKLGRYRCIARALHPDFGDKCIKIEIDPRLDSFNRTYGLIHEPLHHAVRDMHESEVERISLFIAQVLDDNGWELRKVGGD